MVYKRFITLFLTIFLMGAVLTGCGSTDTGAAEEADTAGKEEEAASDFYFESFSAVDLEGNTVDQSIFADYDLTMINVWGTFCGPCLNEMPDLGQLSVDMAEEGVQVLGVCIDLCDNNGELVDSQVELAKKYVEETGAAYTHLTPDIPMLTTLGAEIQVVPTTIFVDSEGKQVGDWVFGSKSYDSWCDVIESYKALLEE